MSRAELAGIILAKSIIEIVNLMYQRNTANNFFKGLLSGLKKVISINEWIDIKKEQPKEGEEVLVYFPGALDCKSPSFHFLKVTDGKAPKDAEFWNKQVLRRRKTMYLFGGFRVDLQPYITHWLRVEKPKKF